MGFINWDDDLLEVEFEVKQLDRSKLPVIPE